MLCHDARRSARYSGGELVLLEDQDRSLWDAAQLDEGRAALDRAVGLRGRGPYVLQAAIASLQTARRRSTGGRSRSSTPSSREITARRSSSSTALWRSRRRASRTRRCESSKALALDDYRYLHSTRAELLRRLGREDEARTAYRRALELTRTEPERRFIERRLAES